MVGETKGVVGAEVEDLLAGRHGDVRALVRGDDAFALGQSGGINLGEGLLQVGGEGGIHFCEIVTRRDLCSKAQCENR